MPKPLLIYDGECPVCCRAVAWLRAQAPPDAIEFLACQDPARADRAPQVTEAMCLEAMQWIEPGGGVRAGAAALPAILRRTPAYAWLAPLLAAPPAAWIAPPVYRWIARRRFAISGLFARKQAGAACGPGGACGR